MNGVVIIDKSKGYTSHDVVNIIRKTLNMKKVGHAGTLDPNATGVLPILIGEATKISKYLIEHDKTYVAELALGNKTTTGDSEGKIIEEKAVPKLTIDEIEKTLEECLGKQKQKPPAYSAIKINGKKAYEYAREGKEIELEEREIEIHKIKLIKYENEIITFEVNCSKGTYIRVLCEDIAKKLKTVGNMKNLRRTKVDNFNLGQAVALEEIKGNSSIVGEKIISIEKIFENQERIQLNEYKLNLFLNGVKLTYNKPNGVYRIYNENKFIGLGIIENNLLKRDIVIWYI
mgnify:FL=1